MDYLYENLKDFLDQFEIIIKSYKEKNKVKVVGYSCDNFPIEVLAAFGFLPLRFPPLLDNSGRCFSNHLVKKEIYDYVVLSAPCHPQAITPENSSSIYFFKPFEGHGSEASLQLHHEMEALLKFLGVSNIRNMDPENLKKVVTKYNNLRRIMKELHEVRFENHQNLNYNDYLLLMTVATALPPDFIMPHLSRMLRVLSEKKRGARRMLPVVVYGGLLAKADFLEDIEEAGFFILDDDFCNGRRQFDLLHETDSEYLYYEILKAFSYKSLCPGNRSAELRFELFYRLMKNFEIEAIIFIEDKVCAKRREEIDFLRKKLMAIGVDPLVIKSKDLKKRLTEIRKYYIRFLKAV